MKRVGVVLILLLAFCGLADSAYLAQHEAAGTPLLCDIQSLTGCNIVANSHYTHLFGIPLAEYGVLFYGMLFVLAALELVLFDQLLRRLLQLLAVIGVAASLYFSFVQVFLIGALCVYCDVSAGIALTILILASFIEPVRRRSKHTPLAPTPPEAMQSTAPLA